MKSHLAAIRSKSPFFIIALIVVTWLLLQTPSQALMALPDIGINYQTMTVNQQDKLKAAGMKSAVQGDKITMNISKNGFLIFKNQRTAETITYPPKRQK